MGKAKIPERRILIGGHRQDPLDRRAEVMSVLEVESHWAPASTTIIAIARS